MSPPKTPNISSMHIPRITIQLQSREINSGHDIFLTPAPGKVLRTEEAETGSNKLVLELAYQDKQVNTMFT